MDAHSHALVILCVVCAAASVAAQGPPAYKRYVEYDSYGNDIPGGTYTNIGTEDLCASKCSSWGTRCTGYVWSYNIPGSSPWYNYCWLKQVGWAINTSHSWGLSHMR
jgi:hypothetical protein